MEDCEAMVHQLVAFLKSHRYRGEVTIKGRTGPSIDEFKKIFEFMVCLHLPGLKLGPKIEEEFPRLMRDLGCSSKVEASLFRNISVPATWALLLEALTFLRTLIEVSENADFRELFDGDTESQEMYEFVSDAYVLKRDGHDEALAKLQEDFCKKIVVTTITDKEVEDQENELRQRELVLSNVEKEEKLRQRVLEKRKLEGEVEIKKKILEQQKLAGFDPIKLKQDHRTLKGQIMNTEKIISEAQKVLEEKEVSFCMQQERIASQVAEFNHKARLMQLTSSDGVLLTMKAGLAQSESIIPEIVAFDGRLAEDFRKVEEELQEADDAIAAGQEELKEYTAQLETAKDDLAAVQKRCDNSKKAYERKLQDLRIRIAEEQAAIADEDARQGQDSDVTEKLEP